MSYNNKIGWRFDNTYSKLPSSMLAKLSPTPVKAPELVILNHSLSKVLGLDFSSEATDYAKRSLKRKDVWQVVRYDKENYDKYWYKT